MQGMELRAPTQPIQPIAVLPQSRSYKQQVLAQLKDTLGPIRSLFDDESVNEIMVNGPSDVFVVRLGRTERYRVELSARQIESAIVLLASMVNQEIGEKSNRRILSGRLPGFRVEAMLPPVAIKGPSMCIRRHASRVFTLEEYIKSGVLSEHYAQVIVEAIGRRENILIVGGTGSGKTTLMNTVLTAIPQDQRLFVIETVHELQIKAENNVLVECDDERGVTPRKAVRTAMRYAPDRIIVGELRGPEAYDWLDAANTGHPGSLATIHANSAPRALPRLENLLLMAAMGVPHEAIRVAIAETVNLMVYIERKENQRRVSQISRLYEYDRSRGQYITESL